MTCPRPDCGGRVLWGVMWNNADAGLLHARVRVEAGVYGGTKIARSLNGKIVQITLVGPKPYAVRFNGACRWELFAFERDDFQVLS